MIYSMKSQQIDYVECEQLREKLATKRFCSYFYTLKIYLLPQQPRF